MTRGTIQINKWREYQHYKNRNPPWVKVHRSLLCQDWYRGLSDGAARFLVELWLLASSHDGIVPYDSLMIARDTNRPSTDMLVIPKYLQELASTGAIILAGTDASEGFVSALAPRGSEVSEVQSSETTSPAAPHDELFGRLLETGIPLSYVAQCLHREKGTTWWDAALEATGNADELRTFLTHLHGTLKDFNPCRVFNMHTQAGAMHFRQRLNAWRRDRPKTVDPYATPVAPTEHVGDAMRRVTQRLRA